MKNAPLSWNKLLRRNNPLKNVRLCQLFGDDVRLKGSCGAYSRDLYGR